MSEHTDQEYIGDGVYASFDGFQIWLAADNHKNVVIALEPNIFDALIAYRERLIEKYVGESE